MQTYQDVFLVRASKARTKQFLSECKRTITGVDYYLPMLINDHGKSSMVLYFETGEETAPIQAVKEICERLNWQGRTKDPKTTICFSVQCRVEEKTRFYIDVHTKATKTDMVQVLRWIEDTRLAYPKMNPDDRTSANALRAACLLNFERLEFLWADETEFQTAVAEIHEKTSRYRLGIFNIFHLPVIRISLEESTTNPADWLNCQIDKLSVELFVKHNTVSLPALSVASEWVPLENLVRVLTITSPNVPVEAKESLVQEIETWLSDKLSDTPYTAIAFKDPLESLYTTVCIYMKETVPLRLVN